MKPKYSAAFVHVYRCNNGALRAVDGDNREWQGRRSALVKTYRLWENATLTEIPARCADRQAV